jgi:hypothetical protein
MGEVKTKEGKAHDLLKEAYEVISEAVGSRENSLVKTKLEEAIMWNNKDRTIKGEFSKKDTFVG